MKEAPLSDGQQFILENRHNESATKEQQKVNQDMKVQSIKFLATTTIDFGGLIPSQPGSTNPNFSNMVA